MTDMKKAFKIIIFLLAAVGLILYAAFIIWTESTKIRPAMSEDELQIFDDYTMFDGNLFCLNAEKYLGTVFHSDMESYQNDVRQDYYSVEGVSSSELILSYTKRMTLLKNNDEAFSVLCGKQQANPLFTWEIESIEICDITANYGTNEKDSSDPKGARAILNYGIEDLEATRKGYTQRITDKEEIELFLSSVKASYDAEDTFIDDDLKSVLLKENAHSLNVLVKFSNTPNVIWIAPIYIDKRDGQVYIKILKRDSTTKGLKTVEHWIPADLAVNEE